MKKIKFMIMALVALTVATTASAQGKWGKDSAECIKYLSYYQEYYKQKNYESAIPNWREAYRLCPPTCSQNMLLNGMTLVRKLITKNQKNPQYRQALVDTLLTLHDQRIQCYPKHSVAAYNAKGQDVFNYIKNDNARLYSTFEDIIAHNGKQTKSTLLVFDLNSAIEMYKAGKLNAEDVINIYTRNTEILSEGEKSCSESEKEQYAKVRTDMESLFAGSKVASCENLIAIFGPRYEANPQDEELVERVVKMLGSTEGCTSNDLFFKAITSLYKMKPSYTSAYYLYKLNAANDKVNDAIKYLDEAIAYEESDAATDAAYSFELAAFCVKNGRNAKAVECAKKAASLDESYAGKSYMLIGQIWGSSACGGDEISKRAQYWVAVDYMLKAREADPSLAEDATKMIGAYSQYYPPVGDAFMYGLKDGDSYTVHCNGMSAVTRVRTQK